MAATFDGVNLLIVLDSDPVLDVAIDLYSDWKEWTKIGDNGKYPPAFRTIGGDPLGGTLKAGAFFFLQNQYGWRIRPAEQDYELVVIGNLYPEIGSIPMFVPTLGEFTVPIMLERASLTQTILQPDSSGALTLGQFIALK